MQYSASLSTSGSSHTLGSAHVTTSGSSHTSGSAHLTSSHSSGRGRGARAPGVVVCRGARAPGVVAGRGGAGAPGVGVGGGEDIHRGDVSYELEYIEDAGRVKNKDWVKIRWSDGSST